MVIANQQWKKWIAKKKTNEVIEVFVLIANKRPLSFEDQKPTIQPALILKSRTIQIGNKKYK